MINRRRKVHKGLPLSGGIVLGYSRIIPPDHVRVAEVAITFARIQKEIVALEDAVRQTVDELTLLRESAGKRIGGPIAKVFDAQLLIAQDGEFLGRVEEFIKENRRNAGFAYNTLIQENILRLQRSDDPYIRNMAQDIQAVSERVLSHLSGYRAQSNMRLPADTIMIAKSFTPGEILSYRNRKAAGFVAGEGGRSSHMALIARSLIAPLVIVTDCWSVLPDRCRMILDGTQGKLIFNPTEDEWAEYQVRRRKQGPAAVTRIKKLTTIPPRTSDGQPVQIAGNLELPGPLDEVLSSKKFPIGLYRTEFLYLERNEFPNEETQYQFYKQIAETYKESIVTLRTFDLGGDKVGSDGSLPREENPALGWRGIRVMLDMSNLFKTQIRAMLRASIYGKFRILLPMISDVSEVTKARKLIAQVSLELRRSDIPYDKSIPLGVMIEVPSAALTSDLLTRKVDFISIGTNDLTQYTLSADRNNAKVESLYDPLHPSVLALIRMVVLSAAKHGKPVSICGEVAGDPLALPLFIGMGVDQLSMNPARIFDACRLISKIDSNLVKMLVKPVMNSSSTIEVKRKLESFRASLKL